MEHPRRLGGMNSEAYDCADKHLREWQAALKEAEKTGKSRGLIWELRRRKWLQCPRWRKGASVAETSVVRDKCEAARDRLLLGDLTGARASLAILQLELAP